MLLKVILVKDINCWYLGQGSQILMAQKVIPKLFNLIESEHTITTEILDGILEILTALSKQLCKCYETLYDIIC